MSSIEDDARSVFLAAVAHAPEEWPALLDEACGNNAELRRRVDQLLEAHQAMGSIQELGANSPAATLDNSPITEGPGATIGPYKLLEEIGEGGFGVVFMAEQTEPVRRKVALKILKPGMDTRQVVARFEAERQALAIMDHPNIAKVFDAGATASGRPYFVMELVRGTPITEFCDVNHLAPRQRLELFATVCQAVQHAHQKGIIHRDLKPSNVLVSRHDTTPTVKVIDFGVAKALGQELTEKTLFTGIAQMIGTPLYMSPEQAGMSDLDVDTRSDIYSLGVLLYELLTGTTPFTKERFKKAAFDEIRRIIREEEPPKPSTRLSGSTESLPSISAVRQTEPAKLTRLIRGDLDWIVMKCLEKDRERRYATASGLAADLHRYLADEPVQACPPSAWYRFRKFARRNKIGIGFAGLVVGALILAATGLVVSNALIRKEQRRAEAALAAEQRQHNRAEANFRLALQSLDQLYTEFAQERLAHRPDLKPLQREFLEKALTFYEGFARENGDEPKARLEVARARWRVGNVRQQFGDLIKAEESYRGALSLLEDSPSDDNASQEWARVRAGCQMDLGVLLMQTDRYAAAESIEREALAVAERLSADNPATPIYRFDQARWLSSFGGLLARMKQPEEALRVRQQAADLLAKLATQYPKDPAYRHHLAIANINLGNSHPEAGAEHGPKANPAGEVAFRRAKTILENLVGEFPARPDYRWDLALADFNLGALLHKAGRLKEAEPVEREAISRYQKLAYDFPDIPDYRFELARSFGNLALLLEKTDRPAEAERALRGAIQSLELLVASVPDRIEYRDYLLGYYFSLGQLLDDMAQYGEAEKLLRRGLQRYPNTLNLTNQLAWLLANCADPNVRKPAEAVELAKSLVRVESKEAEPWQTLGVAHYRAGNYADAVNALEKAISISPPSDSRRWLFLAMAESKLGHQQQARKWYDLAAAWMEKYRDQVNADSRARLIFPKLHAEAEQVLGTR
jgi:serine/threonine protein kinase/tetratricopeptide (TPR) repeat protein